jgi:ParB-like chromosome segregation protein Spo0J
MPAPDIVGEWVPVGDLVPWDQNPRDNDQSVDEVAGSIRRFGFAAPIIARRADSMVIAGHTRLKAAQRLGINKVPVRWMDLDPAEARMLALADNKLNERADWDDPVLAQVLEDLAAEGADLSGLGWDEDELQELITVPDFGAVDIDEQGQLDEIQTYDCPHCRTPLTLEDLKRG